MSSEGNVCNEENLSCDSTDDKEDDGTIGSLRRRKIVKCAKIKIEQGYNLLITISYN